MERLEKERERGDKERERERERDRERIHARERDMLHYDINDEELLNERNYSTAADYNLASSNRSHIPQHHSYHHRHMDENDVLMHERDRDRDRDRDRERDRDRDRYPSVNQPPQLTRREREEYSPNRGGGNSRRILNAI